MKRVKTEGFSMSRAVADRSKRAADQRRFEALVSHQIGRAKRGEMVTLSVKGLTDDDLKMRVKVIKALNEIIVGDDDFVYVRPERRSDLSFFTFWNIAARQERRDQRKAS
jgi:hypothetical protein